MTVATMKVNVEFLYSLLRDQIPAAAKGELGSGSTLYELVQTAPCEKIMKDWFDINADDELDEAGECVKVLDENRFVGFLRSLSDLTDHKILDMFDLFDREKRGAIAFGEFKLLVHLLAARECHQGTVFLHSKSRVLYSLLQDGGDVLSYHGLLRLTYALELDEARTLEHLGELGLNPSSTLTDEDFEEVVFALFDEWDSSAKNRSPKKSRSPSKKESHSRGGGENDTKQKLQFVGVGEASEQERAKETAEDEAKEAANAEATAAEGEAVAGEAVKAPLAADGRPRMPRINIGDDAGSATERSQSATASSRTSLSSSRKRRIQATCAVM